MDVEDIQSYSRQMNDVIQDTYMNKQNNRIQTIFREILLKSQRKRSMINDMTPQSFQIRQIINEIKKNKNVNKKVTKLLNHLNNIDVSTSTDEDIDIPISTDEDIDIPIKSKKQKKQKNAIKKLKKKKKHKIKKIPKKKKK